MALAAPRFCAFPGCGVLVRGGSRCERHQVARRPSSPDVRTRGRKWMAIRAGVLADEPRCVHCLQAGRLRLAVEVDHIVELVDGGTDAPDNLQGLCRSCHEAKTEAALRARRAKAT